MPHPREQPDARARETRFDVLLARVRAQGGLRIWLVLAGSLAAAGAIAAAVSIPAPWYLPAPHAGSAHVLRSYHSYDPRKEAPVGYVALVFLLLIASAGLLAVWLAAYASLNPRPRR